MRHLRIAARFVSGYYLTDSGDPSHELHAWIEVYLPGAGLIEFDPSYGSLAGTSHIPICSSTHYQNTLPVIGSFRSGASSIMNVFYL